LVAQFRMLMPQSISPALCPTEPYPQICQLLLQQLSCRSHKQATYRRPLFLSPLKVQGFVYPPAQVAATTLGSVSRSVPRRGNVPLHHQLARKPGWGSEAWFAGRVWQGGIIQFWISPTWAALTWNSSLELSQVPSPASLLWQPSPIGQALPWFSNWPVLQALQRKKATSLFQSKAITHLPKNALAVSIEEYVYCGKLKKAFAIEVFPL